MKKRLNSLKWFFSGFQLGFLLCMSEFKIRYRQSFLGVLWAFVNPVLFTFAFFFLNIAGVVNPGEITVPYPLYAFTGVVLWSLFVSVSGKIAGIPVYSSDILTMMSFNRSALISLHIFESLIEFAVKITVLIVFLIFYGTSQSFFSFFLFIASVVPFLMFSVATGLFLGAFSGITRDIVKALPVFLNLLMFITPVVYTTSFRNGIIGMLSFMNPLSYMLDLSRNIIFGTHTGFSFSYLISALISILFFTEALYLFKLSLPVSVERI